MKKLLLLAVLAVAAVGAYAQGTVNFANVAVGVNAPITNAAGVRASGAAYTAQLYVGPSGTVDANSLVAVSGTAAFNTGTQAGYFTGGQRAISGSAGGSTVTLQVRAWNTAAGATYEAAMSNPSGEGNWSNLIQVTLGTPPGAPANMTGLQGFQLVPVPEPSSIALGLLGLGAIALFRRRK
jgi:hypothetical protein